MKVLLTKDNPCVRLSGIQPLQTLGMLDQLQENGHNSYFGVWRDVGSQKEHYVRACLHLGCLGWNPKKLGALIDGEYW